MSRDGRVAARQRSDQGPARRRPGPGAVRLQGAARRRRRHHGGGRGRHRCRGRRAGPGHPARRRPHGHPHAGAGRDQGHRPDRETRGLEQVRVLILTTYDTDAYVFEALQAGASGFLLKDAGPAELLHAIRVIAAGDALLAPRITRRLIAQFTAERIATQVAEDRLAVLTPREREVLALVGQGLSNDEIGAELFLSPATARTHVSHAMAKLGARDRAQLVVIAYQTGLAKP